MVRVLLADPEDRVVAETSALVYRLGPIEWSMALPGTGFLGRVMWQTMAGTRTSADAQG